TGVQTCAPPIYAGPPFAGYRRGGAEVAVELAGAVDRADDRLDGDVDQAELAAAGLAQRGDDLVVGEDLRDVVGLAAQPCHGLAQAGAASGAGEVGLGVGVGETGVGHGQRPFRSNSARGVERRVECGVPCAGWTRVSVHPTVLTTRVLRRVPSAAVWAAVCAADSPAASSP